MKNLKYSAFSFLFLLLTSCASTKIVESWKEPNKEITISKLKKVLIIAMFKDETSNRKVEDQMMNFLDGKGVRSYNYLNKNFDKNNVNAIQNKIKKDGFDGALTLRLIDVDKETIYQKNARYGFPINKRDFSNYYYDNINTYNNADNFSTTKTYIIETNVYSIIENKIIWSALSETSDPQNVKKLTQDVAQAVYKQMIKDQLIK